MSSSHGVSLETWEDGGGGGAVSSFPPFEEQLFISPAEEMLGGQRCVSEN